MRPWHVLLTLPRSELERRIDQRARAMVEGGIVDETRRALDHGLSPSSPGLDAIGYREVMAFLEGELESSELVPAITRSTRRYAKRQETWFRNQLRGGALWALDAARPPEELAVNVWQHWEKEARD